MRARLDFKRQTGLYPRERRRPRWRAQGRYLGFGRGGFGRRAQPRGREDRRPRPPPGVKPDNLGREIEQIRVSKSRRYDRAFVPAAVLEADADTVALYRFDEGQGDKLTDSSGNGHHGKIVGAKWVKVR